MKNFEVKKSDVERAFVRFDRGERYTSPRTGKPVYHKPKYLYVINKKNKHNYPAKQIWGLASAHAEYSHVYEKWFNELGYVVVEIRDASTSEFIANNFQEKVKKSQKSLSSARRERLKKTPKKPTEKLVPTRVFNRNPDVVAEVLLRSKNKCECCGEDAPFKRESDNQPYLEVHHLKQLANGGDDTVANAVALCPNCHREQHYGELEEKPRLPVRKKTARK